MRNNKKTSSSCHYPQNQIKLQPFISSGQIDLAWSHSWSKMGPESACSPCHLLGPGIGKESTKNQLCNEICDASLTGVMTTSFSSHPTRLHRVLHPSREQTGGFLPSSGFWAHFSGRCCFCSRCVSCLCTVTAVIDFCFFCPNVCFIITQAKRRGAGWGLLE